MEKRKFLVTESEMDDFQRKVINKRINGSLIVKGCAGSGKSVIAFWHLYDIVANNRGSAQLIVFTKTLKEYFEEGCRGEGIDSELIDYWWHWRKNPKFTDYILVDEAQDFSEKEINMFMRHANKAVLLYGDSSQQIYAFRAFQEGEEPPVSMEEMQRITSYPTEQLVYNHRLPKKIARVAQSVNNENDALEERCMLEGDEKPFFLRFASLDDQLDMIAQIIRARGLDDVGILLPKNDQVRVVADYLSDCGLNVEAKYREGRSSTNDISFATEAPKVMTYHSAKGLQFRTVFLPESQSPFIHGRLEPFYVAMTRSYQSLYILYTGGLPPVLQDIPSNLYETDIAARETEVL